MQRPVIAVLSRVDPFRLQSVFTGSLRIETLLWAQAVSTTLASDGMEAARRACGGHGYSLLSGLPTVFTHYVQNVTWEGDNNVMLLQVPPCCPLQEPSVMPLVTQQSLRNSSPCSDQMCVRWVMRLALPAVRFSGQVIGNHRLQQTPGSIFLGALEGASWGSVLRMTACLQTARYLVKRLLAAQAGKGSPGGSAGYTAKAADELAQRCPVLSPRDWLDPAVQSSAFRCASNCTMRVMPAYRMEWPAGPVASGTHFICCFGMCCATHGGHTVLQHSEH